MTGVESAPPLETPGQPRRTTQARLARFIPRTNEAISVVVLILVTFGFTISTNGLLLAPRTLNLMATFGPEILLITIAVGLVLVVGQIDLSVGSMYVVSSVILAAVVHQLGLPVWVGVLAGIVAGTIMGLINGVLVVTTQVSSFIVTLGTMWAYRGLMLVIIGSATMAVYDRDSAISALDIIAGKTFGIAHQVLWLGIIAAVLAVMYHHSRFGVWIRAVGSNERSARMMGIPTRRVTVAVFTLSGLLCGVAGVIQVAQSRQAVPQSGDTVMLTALAGAIVGGVALTGGRGGVLGPLVGGLTLLVISLGFIMMGVVEFWTQILTAVAVVFTAFAFHRLELLRVRRPRT